MILAFEMTWKGASHAYGNSATLQILARAFPGQTVRMHADPTHLEVLARDPALTSLPNVELVPIPVSGLHYGKTHIVSPSRALQEASSIRAGLARVPRGEPCLLFLISANAGTPFAAAAMARLSGRRVGLQVGFHGNLNDAFGWRTRNPLLRAFDTRSVLEARLPVPTRFLVLEEAIRTALAERLPATAARTDVLPLPVNTSEADLAGETRLEPPLRIGLLGGATLAKGFDLFLSIAERLRARWGERVEFVHVGRLAEALDDPRTAALAHPPTRDALSRAEFTARLASLHYVFLPYREAYYNLSASGTLIDALTWLKPVIASRVPLTEQFVAEHGEIGTLCDTEADFEAAIEAVLRDMDGARYAAQVAALRAARETRRVEALVARYRRIVEQGFPGLIE